MEPTKLITLPLCIPFPSNDFIHEISDSDWQICAESWQILLNVYLQVPSHSLNQDVARYDALIEFLTSFVRQAAGGRLPANTSILRRPVFLSTRRLMLDAKPPPASFLSWRFLGDFSRVFHGVHQAQEVLKAICVSQAKAIETSVARLKAQLEEELGMGVLKSLRDTRALKSLLTLANSVSIIANVLLSGSHFLDAASNAYPHLDANDRRAILLLLCTMLQCLNQDEESDDIRLSEVLDALKSSMVAGKATEPGQSLLLDLVNDTSILSYMKRRLAGARASHVNAAISALRSLQFPDRCRRKTKSISLHVAENPGQRDIAQFTDRARHASSRGQMHDLFPGLSSDSIETLLAYYDYQVEIATTALLEHCLPAHLKSIGLVHAPTHASIPASENDTSQMPSSGASKIVATSKDPTTISTDVGQKRPFSHRRNKYDDDALDSLDFSRSRVLMGKRSESTTADVMLDQGAQDRTAKAAILAALASFNADDDEHDDTYDAEDVGGTVDIASDSANDSLGDEQEETLYRAWIHSSDKDLFAREPAARRSAERALLKLETSLTDEAIEGWAIMLKREPARLRRLERRFGDRDMLQVSEHRGRDRLYTAEVRHTDVDMDRATSTSRESIQGNIRRDSRPDGKGSEDATASLSDTKNSRPWRSKDVQKARRANHNRRNQRAKKMARGG